MRLLVSVADAREAREALRGGADIIDAKDPRRGALGAVDARELHAIVAAVDGARPVSAALGDAMDEASLEGAARAGACARLAYVKVGFAGIDDAARVESLLAAAVRGAQVANGSTGVIAVAYADARRARTVPPARIIEAAERAGAMGVLLDTAFKDGGGLFDAMPEEDVAGWVRSAHAAALTVALAGTLVGADLGAARVLGADIVGVRTAACEGGRTGRVTGERVAMVAASLGRARRAPASVGTVLPAGGDGVSRRATLP